MNPVKCKNCRIALMRVIYSVYSKSISLCESSTSTSSAPSQSELSREIQRRFENLKFIEKKKQYEDREILSQIQSIAAQKYLKNDKERFSKLEEKNKILKKTNAPRNINSKRIILPLKADENSGIHIQANSESIDKNLDGKSNAEVDKGFFVHGDEYSEDYSAATTAEMPADEMTEPPIRYYGNLTEAVEDIEFQLPGQISKPAEKNAKLTENSPTYIGDWASNYGTVEVSEEELIEFKELKDAKCASCGAQFHCYNRSLPGFVPLELLKEIERNSKKDPFYQKNDFNCRRCYLLKEYNFLLNLNVCNVDYAKMMSHLKLIQEILILLIVDMTDLQGSIIHELPKIIGSHKPLIVIGNKLDLLPPDTKPGYLRHYRDSLRKAIADAGISKNFNVLKYLLISAKTGFGVEDLITNIYKNWIGPRGVLRNDIYVIGATNAGKSTLFNTFIQSDLCKVRAMDLVERVTTSIWPGTTMSLLKFPLMNPSPQKLELRRRRLISMQAWAKKEEQISRLFSKSGNPKYLVLHGLVGSTFKEREENLQPISTSKIIKQFNGELTPTEELEELKEEKKNKMGLNDRAFQKGHWCYDTPGTVNNKQVLDLFTLEELVNVVPRSTLTPRIFIVFPGQSLLLGAIACIDILQSSTATKEMVPIYVTVFASQKLKVNVMASKYADEFVQKNRGDVSLGAPIGNAERLAKFPELDGIDFEIDGESKLENGGIADIVLSSIGWAMVTTEANFVRVHASTPAGRGLLLRKPPLIPFAADYREKRIKGTAEYTIRPFDHEYDARQRKGDFGKRNNKNGDLPRDIVNFDLA